MIDKLLLGIWLQLTRLANAEYMTGLFYQKGMGIPSDPRSAAYWVHEAAEHGMDNAQLLLGIMYGQGQGFQKMIN